MQHPAIITVCLRLNGGTNTYRNRDPAPALAPDQNQNRNSHGGSYLNLEGGDCVECSL